jgi:hypothetical protein
MSAAWLAVQIRDGNASSNWAIAQLAAIDWTPAARPFFEKQRECPQGDSNP